MWLFTQHGFTSIVQDKDDANYLFVRFRCKEDADSFVAFIQEAIPGVQGFCVPIQTPDRDYHWRIRVTRDVVKAMMVAMVDKLNYTNFKDRIHTQNNHNRDEAYMETWSAMYRFQYATERPGFFRREN